MDKLRRYTEWFELLGAEGQRGQGEGCPGRGGPRLSAVCVLDRDAGATALLAGHHLVLRALVRDPDGAR
ncbi:hypothetical protein ACWGRV_07980 [Streptomyces sp. NPDC055663]